MAANDTPVGQASASALKGQGWVWQFVWTSVTGAMTAATVFAGDHWCGLLVVALVAYGDPRTSRSVRESILAGLVKRKLGQGG